MKSLGRQLEDYLAQVRREGQPFDWQKNNCAHFCNNWRVFLGQEGADHLLPPVASKEDARRYFLKHNEGLSGLVSQTTSMVQVPPSFVRLGDIVLYSVPSHDLVALGIAAGGAVVFLGEDGMPVVANVPITHAWRVYE